MKTIAISVVALALIAIIGAVGVVQYGAYQVNQPLTLKKETLFEVKKGQSSRKIAKSFEQNGWIDNRFWLKVYTRLNPELTAIKEGVYLIKPDQTLLETITMIVSGKEHQFKITFIEGSKFTDWLEILNNAPYLEHSLASSDIQSINQKLSIDKESPEGLLFPETYAYTAGTKDLEILKRAQAKMETYITSAWEKRDESVPFKTAYEALIMASIIEKETGQVEEQPLISSVFVNRLNTNMRLQTDPTVIYGLGDVYRGDITRAHLRQKTRYNTYRINGLPPTPIAMPGKTAIDATLNPASSDYYYFVSKGNGWHQFSKTLKEHNKAVAKYQLGQ